MKSYVLKSIVAFLLISVFISCGKKTVSIPSDVLPKKQMIEVMTDVQLAEAAKDVAMSEDKTKNTIQEYYAFIFNKHRITKEQFQKSFDFYKTHPELMEEIYSEVINRLSELQAKS